MTAATQHDIDELMSWFPDARSVEIWGGPGFRYPFTRESFHEDCRWRDFASYCVRNPAGNAAAFGQLDERYGRAHLARLVANPECRGSGVGQRLIRCLLEKARHQHGHSECGLFVYRDNEPANRCYRSVGFDVHAFPDDAPMPEKCFYMTVSF